MKRSVFFIIILFLTVSCAGHRINRADKSLLLCQPEDKSSIVSQFAPELLIEEPDKKYNIPGFVYAEEKDGKETVSVNPEKPSYYFDIRDFTGKKGHYKNLIFRLNFIETPDGFLGKGKNVGLFFIVTMDENKRPLLFTTVHTCGCYLAFIPTSFMPEDYFPKGWKKNGRQDVYSESLPNMLDYGGKSFSEFRIRVVKRSGNHRVADLFLVKKDEDTEYRKISAGLLDMDLLEKLPLGNGKFTSFYEEDGSDKGFVKGSKKPYERIFMSWWAFDWRIGQDKKLGKDKDDGNSFYTSIKPWVRYESDMRDFAAFLGYWGWKF